MIGDFVDRIVTERITEKSNFSPKHAQVLRRAIQGTIKEMKEIVSENRTLQYSKTWLKKKTHYLRSILEKNKINPATRAYITIKQIEDAARHFVAAYRANKNSDRV